MNILVCTGNFSDNRLVMTAVDHRLWLNARERNVQEIDVERSEEEPDENSEPDQG